MEHHVRPDDDGDRAAAVAAPAVAWWRRLAHRFTRLMDDREPGDLSPLTPHMPDGRRSRVFPFNGNGRGR